MVNSVWQEGNRKTGQHFCNGNKQVTNTEVRGTVERGTGFRRLRIELLPYSVDRSVSPFLHFRPENWGYRSKEGEFVIAV